MKSPFARRIFLVAGAALCLANAGAGECGLGANGAPNNTDLGDCVGFCGLSDMGSAGSADLGLIAGDSITMKVPKPFQSLVPVDTSLEFDVGLGSASPTSYEPNISITPYTAGNADMGSAPVAGAFSWKQPSSGGPARLTFIPNAPLDPNTDYVVHVLSLSGPKHYALSTGFSTGPNSRPRVSALVLAISSGPSAAVAISFSEPMDAATLNGRVTVLSGTTTLSTTLSSSATGDTVVQITNASKIAGKLTVRIDGNATSQAGGQLVPGNDWDSPMTFANGAFEYTFTGVSISSPNTQTWAPIVN